MKKSFDLQTTYYQDFREMLIDLAAKHKNKVAITTFDRKGTRLEKTYAQLSQDSLKFANALCYNNYSEKNIAIIAENSYEWIVAYMGIAAAGSVAVCIDTEDTDKSIQNMLIEADCHLAVVSSATASVLDDFQPNTDFTVICTNKDSDFQSIYEFSQIDSKQRLEPIIKPEQTASIVFTSGTTSVAKPVMLSHKGILFNVGDALKKITMSELTFNSLPLYHSYGLTAGLLCGLVNGSNVCVNCDVKRLLRDMSMFKPRLVIAVPLIVETIELQMSKIASVFDFDAKKATKKTSVFKFFEKNTTNAYAECFKGTDFEHLEMIISGGAHLSADVAWKLGEYGVTVIQGYGITECSPMISCNRVDTNKFGSVGEVLDGYTVKIHDGEIYVKGYSLMNGYYNDPTLTLQAFDGEWFKTGDLGYLDKKERLHITGRKKNLIVMKNGKKISAEEIENELLKIPMIKTVVVHGALSGTSTDDVTIAAAVYPDPVLTEGMNSYEILNALQVEIDEINGKLPTYQQIQMINIRQHDFDRTATKKIKRQLI